MRPLKSHFPTDALTTLETVLKQTKEARILRRAQAVREVVAGHHVNAVSETFHLPNAALRKWVQRLMGMLSRITAVLRQLPVLLQEAMTRDGMVIARLFAVMTALLAAGIVPSRAQNPPIPDLALWETWMVDTNQGGAYWCNALPASWTGDESEAWYYDGERVFYQISDYVTTNKTFWNNCAQKSERLYRSYVIANNGRIDGWQVFPHGLYMDYVRTGDTTSKSAALMLANGLWSSDNAALWTEDGIPAVDHFTYTREISYALNTHTVAEKLGQAHRAWGDRLMEGLLKHIDQWFITKNSADIKFFMVGLNMEALIGWYELHPDPRIPPAIKTALDGLWPHWNAGGKYFPYCYTRPGGTLGSPAADCGDDYGLANAILNNLIAPAYAWYYRYSGDPVYRDRGDQLFSGGAQALERARGGWTGKEFSQNYRWSVDYVRWRNAEPGPDTTPPSAPRDLHAAAVSSTEIDLSWSASTDDVGVTGYRIYHCQGTSCTPTVLTTIGNVTSFQDTGLSPSTTNRYTVTALDAADNESSKPTAVAATTAPSQSADTHILLDDFEGGLRLLNPTGTDDTKYMWNQCDICNVYAGGDPEPGTQSVTTATAHDGTKSLRVRVSAGTAYMQFYPYLYDCWCWHYLKEFARPPSAWQQNTYNRLRFWMKLPLGIQKATGGAPNIHFGTYNRRPDDTSGGQESDNKHWYHHLNIPYTGEWHQVIIDTHPNHLRYANGNQEHGNQEYPFPNFPTHNYFDVLTRFYVDLHDGPSTYPVYFYFDGFELYRESRPENIDQIYSLNGVYVPASNKLHVGWQRNKNESTLKHEVRYAFQDIYTIGWQAATPAPNGIVAPLGRGGYNGMQYVTTQILVSGYSVIYVAIKPQNSTLFRQIAIPLR